MIDESMAVNEGGTVFAKKVAILEFLIHLGRLGSCLT